MIIRYPAFVRHFLFPSILLGVLSSGGAAAADFTFFQAWQVVQRNNDGLAASQANRKEAEYMRDAAKSLYMPELAISGRYSRLDDDVSLTPSQLFASMPSGDILKSFLGTLPGLSGVDFDAAFTSQLAEKNVVNASLGMVWPIYSGGRINAAQDIAEGRLKESGYLLRMKRQALFEQLTKRYFGVVLAKQVLDVRSHAEKGLRKHLMNTKKMEEQGQVARVERLKAAASHAKAEVERRKALRNFELAQLALNRLLKERVDVSPVSGLFINNVMPVLAEVVQATLDSHPELGVLAAKRSQAEGLVDIREGMYFPEASIFGNYSLYKQDTLAAEMVPDWVVGIGVKVPITSRAGRSGKLGAAKSALTKIDHLKAQAIHDLELLTEKTWREAQIAREEFNGLESSLELANENIYMRKKAFSQGLSTSLEVVDAELFGVSVKTQRQAAAYQYVLSLARLLALSNQMPQFFDYQVRGDHE